MRTYQKLMMLAAALLTAGTVAVNAQDFYYDDIYGESPKAKKKTGKATQTEATPSSSTRNVDEYNRRGSYKPVAGTSSVDSLGDNFEYTRRIERFYNPDVVSDADDPEVAYLYNYSNDELADATHKSPATINIYVDNSDPWNNFWSPYYYSSAWAWATTPGYYNPWWHYNYAWGYGPYWSLNWGWNHHWGWDWGWGPSWSWGPGWGPSWGWAPLPPSPRTRAVVERQQTHITRRMASGQPQSQFKHTPRRNRRIARIIIRPRAIVSIQAILSQPRQSVSDRLRLTAFERQQLRSTRRIHTARVRRSL